MCSPRERERMKWILFPHLSFISANIVMVHFEMYDDTTQWIWNRCVDLHVIIENCIEYTVHWPSFILTEPTLLWKWMNKLFKSTYKRTHYRQLIVSPFNFNFGSESENGYFFLTFFLLIAIIKLPFISNKNNTHTHIIGCVGLLPKKKQNEKWKLFTFEFMWL